MFIESDRNPGQFAQQSLHSMIDCSKQFTKNVCAQENEIEGMSLLNFNLIDTVCIYSFYKSTEYDDRIDIFSCHSFERLIMCLSRIME